MNVMIDLETTGVEAGCCILSVALVPFGTLHAPEPFYEKISHADSLREGFVDDPDTIAWWDKQKPEVQAEAFSGTRSAASVAESISHYLSKLGTPKQIHMWGNGKDFDNVILTAFFKKLGMKQPWDFRNNWCYRDFAKLYPQYPKSLDKTAHHALNDADMQARHLSLIFSGIKYGTSPTLPT
jgi:hypothetical protein